jgi:DNA-binding NarL/FixJ family response regulator
MEISSVPESAGVRLPPSEKGRRSLRVLIVGSDADLVEVTSELLGMWDNVEVVGTGHNGADAVELTCCHNPDLLIMDVAMSRVDRIQAAGIISQACPSTMILLTSGEDTPKTWEKCQRAGAHSFLSKSELTKVLSTALVAE